MRCRQANSTQRGVRHGQPEARRRSTSEIGSNCNHIVSTVCEVLNVGLQHTAWSCPSARNRKACALPTNLLCRSRRYNLGKGCAQSHLLLPSVLCCRGRLSVILLGRLSLGMPGSARIYRSMRQTSKTLWVYVSRTEAWWEGRSRT